MKSHDRPHLQALSSVSSSLVTGLRPTLPEVGDEIIAAIRESVPEYARPLEGSFGRGVRAGVGELWRSDGSPQGTRRVAVLGPDALPDLRYVAPALGLRAAGGPLVFGLARETRRSDPARHLRQLGIIHVSPPASDAGGAMLL